MVDVLGGGKAALCATLAAQAMGAAVQAGGICNRVDGATLGMVVSRNSRRIHNEGEELCPKPQHSGRMGACAPHADLQFAVNVPMALAKVRSETGLFVVRGSGHGCESVLA